jgi:hypothetical protein
MPLGAERRSVLPNTLHAGCDGAFQLGYALVLENACSAAPAFVYTISATALLNHVPGGCSNVEFINKKNVWVASGCSTSGIRKLRVLAWHHAVERQEHKGTESVASCLENCGWKFKFLEDGQKIELRGRGAEVEAASRSALQPSTAV